MNPNQPPTSSLAQHPVGAQGKKLLDQACTELVECVSDQLRIKHYSLRTEHSYTFWARQYILFHNKRHPRDMGANEINAFISHLALERKVAASTHTVLAVGARGIKP